MPKKIEKYYICPDSDICDLDCIHKKPHKYHLCRLKALDSDAPCKESNTRLFTSYLRCIDYVEPEPELFLCPKADKCIMDCYHKNPHKHEIKYCNGQGGCDMKCVPEIQADVIFFEEDFKL